MKHLTDEQITGLIGDALPPGERGAADAHLSQCEACRTRLVEASALEQSLGAALAHEPGDDYFSDFADRVGRRIAAAGGAAGAPARPPRSRTPWLLSPRGLAFAGSTAALLVTAGLAWISFHDQDDAARALRTASPNPVGANVRQEAAPGPSRDRATSVAPPDAAPMSETAPAPTAEADRPRPPAAMTPGRTARAQEVRKSAGGEEVTVPSERGAAGAAEDRVRQRDGLLEAAPSPPGSPYAQMKRRAITPLAKDEPAEAPAKSQPGEAVAKLDAQAPAAQAAPSPELGYSLMASGTVAASCGTVRDTRGHAVSGAQVTALRNGVRTTRTGPDGRFCIENLQAGDTVSVLRVGFDPLQVVVGPATSLALELQPVGTLATPAEGFQAKGGEAPSLSRFAAPSTANTAVPGRDPYAELSPSIRAWVSEAREAETRARRENAAAGFERAAEKWSAVAALVSGAAAYEASFQSIAAMREACRIEPTPVRVARFREQLAAFMAGTPRTLPQRETVQRWQVEWRRGAAYR